MSVITTLPNEQTAIPGTFASNLFPSLGRAQGLSMGFYNICGGVRFSITKEGIKKDLDWMKASGIAGVQQFDAGGTMMGGGQSIVDRLPYMSEGWKDAFRYAIGYADELGMEVAIASAPGWSSTGGPWVKPENAMKKLVWRTVEVSGNPKSKKPSVITLPEPFTTVGKYQNIGETSRSGVQPWYQDVAVVAIRIPEVDKTLAALGASVSSSGGDFTVEMLSNGDLADGVELSKNPTADHAWIQYEFPEAVTFKALTLVGGGQRERHVLRIAHIVVVVLKLQA